MYPGILRSAQVVKLRKIGVCTSQGFVSAIFKLNLKILLAQQEWNKNINIELQTLNAYVFIIFLPSWPSI